MVINRNIAVGKGSWFENMCLCMLDAMGKDEGYVCQETNVYGASSPKINIRSWEAVQAQGRDWKVILVKSTGTDKPSEVETN